MKEHIELMIKVPIKAYNQTLAISNEELVTTEEQLKEYEDLVLDVGALGDENHEVKIGAGAFVMIAIEMKRKHEKPDR